MITIMILIAFSIGYWLGKEKIHKNEAIESVLRMPKDAMGVRVPKYKIFNKKTPRTSQERTMDELDKEHEKTSSYIITTSNKI